MKAKELMEELFSLAVEREYSEFGDICKAGDPEREIKKVAVTMFPTVNVIREVKEWEADLLIVHEPLYYNNKEEVLEDDKIALDKKKLVAETKFNTSKHLRTSYFHFFSVAYLLPMSEKMLFFYHFLLKLLE